MRPLRTNEWWGVGAGAAALIAAAFGLAPDPPQSTLLESAEAQHRALKLAGSAVYAPAEYEEYLRAVSRAKEELSAQRGKFYYSQQYLTFNRLSLEALEKSGTAERAALENRAALQREVTDQSMEIRSVVSGIRSRIDRLGISNANRDRLVKVDVLLREAEILGQSRQWHEANDRVAAAQSHARAAQIQQNERVGRLNDAALVKQWDRWVQETMAWSVKNGAAAVVVVKARNVCLLLSSGRIVKSYNADFGKNGVFDKSFRGDEATPEGKYKIIKKKGRGQSIYHKALLINYPNDEDIRAFRRARTLGLLSLRSKLGGLIEIHGDGGRDRNWTQGCVALLNSDMDDIFSRTDIGTPVTIVGNFSDFDRLFGAQLKTGAGRGRSRPPAHPELPPAHPELVEG